MPIDTKTHAKLACGGRRTSLWGTQTAEEGHQFPSWKLFFLRVGIFAVQLGAVLHAEHQIQWEKKSPHTLSDPKLRGEHAGAIHIALKCVLKCRYWCWIPRLEAFERVWWVYLKCKVFISVRATTVACLALALGPTAEVWVNRTLRVTILPPLGIIFMGVTSRTIMTSQLS